MAYSRRSRSTVRGHAPHLGAPSLDGEQDRIACRSSGPPSTRPSWWPDLPGPGRAALGLESLPGRAARPQLLDELLRRAARLPRPRVQWPPNELERLLLFRSRTDGKRGETQA